MSSLGKNTRRPRRVSFAEFSSPTIDKAPGHFSPRPNSTPKPAVNNDSNNSRCPTPQPHSPPSDTCPTSQTPAPDPLAALFTHSVTNTPEGLVIDGVLRRRGPTVHSDLRDPLPQFQPFPGYPPYHNNTGQPHQVNMSTVGAGIMPDPNAVHYQPPVPDTTNGPFQYTYVPRSDPQYMMANGVAAGGYPGFFAPGAFPYQQVQPQNPLPMYTPAVPQVFGVGYMNASLIRTAHRRRAQPGMATAPIPMMAPGPQMPPMPPMQTPYMQCPPVSFQPGFAPPMHCAAAPSGPAFVATGIGQPTPPVTPGVYFPGGNMGGGGGGVEMGKTKTEIEAENQYNAMHNQMNEPQSMKPADDDNSRMYWCRELDGQWTSRSRFSLDRMGNFRWYVTENGVFYAKMLPDFMAATLKGRWTMSYIHSTNPKKIMSPRSRGIEQINGRMDEDLG
ncbi:hypothetical protein F5Y12DRAFT_710244 [Xylaria sp. FL1777]|nr:hypothetical protein F5Y12DRAFT_710244 [Xylaria sp. FL1777]